MKVPHFLIALIAACFVLIPLHASAQTPLPGGPVVQAQGGMAPMGIMGPVSRPFEVTLESVAAKINLSAAQVQKIKKITFDSERAALTIRANIRKAQLDIRELLSAAKAPNEAALMTKLDAIGKLSTELLKVRMKKILKIRASMNPTQWTKFEAQISKMSQFR
jgi:hypothetical protein